MLKRVTIAITAFAVVAVLMTTVSSADALSSSSSASCTNNNGTITVQASDGNKLKIYKNGSRIKTVRRSNLARNFSEYHDATSTAGDEYNVKVFVDRMLLASAHCVNVGGTDPGTNPGTDPAPTPTPAPTPAPTACVDGDHAVVYSTGGPGRHLSAYVQIGDIGAIAPGFITDDVVAIDYKDLTADLRALGQVPDRERFGGIDGSHDVFEAKITYTGPFIRQSPVSEFKVTLFFAGASEGVDVCFTPTFYVEYNESPIGLDIDGSGAVERVSTPVDFDFDADGTTKTTTEWFAPTEGILFDSTIDGPLTGEHLFGDFGDFRDGYEKLATLDTNADGMVSGVEMNGLALWVDANTNGVLDTGETRNLAATGVVSLSTTHTSYLSTATLVDGSTMVTEDLWFEVVVLPAPVATASNVLRNLAISAAMIITVAGAVFVGRNVRSSRQLDTEIAELLNEPVNA